MGTNVHFNLGWYTVFELGQRLLELMGTIASWLSNEVTIPIGSIVAGEFIPGGSLTGTIADFLIGGGLVTLLLYKIVKFIVGMN